MPQLLPPLSLPYISIFINVTNFNTIVCIPPRKYKFLSPSPSVVCMYCILNIILKKKKRRYFGVQQCLWSLISLSSSFLIAFFSVKLGIEKMVKIRSYNSRFDRAGVEDLERRCEVGPKEHVFLFIDTMGDPICRIRNSPNFNMLVYMLLLFVFFHIN